jgi:hypothetical protein
MKLIACRGLVILLLLGLVGGCSPTVRWPRLIGPGTAPYQRAYAEHFDPYPQNDMGPEIVGGRPLEYQKPPNEVQRSRQHTPMGFLQRGARY